MNFKKSRYLMLTGSVVGILIMLGGLLFENEGTIGGFVISGAIVVFASLVQAFVFYRCPYCGYSFMNIRGEIPDYCYKCGKELKED